jgi:hypothetical protein
VTEKGGSKRERERERENLRICEASFRFNIQSFEALEERKRDKQYRKTGSCSSLCTRVLQAKACRQREDSASDVTISKP